MNANGILLSGALHAFRVGLPNSPFRMARDPGMAIPVPIATWRMHPLLTVPLGRFRGFRKSLSRIHFTLFTRIAG